MKLSILAWHSILSVMKLYLYGIWCCHESILACYSIQSAMNLFILACYPTYCSLWVYLYLHEIRSTFVMNLSILALIRYTRSDEPVYSCKVFDPVCHESVYTCMLFDPLSLINLYFHAIRSSACQEPIKKMRPRKINKWNKAVRCNNKTRIQQAWHLKKKREAIKQKEVEKSKS